MKEIEIQNGVSVAKEGARLTIKGPKGSTSKSIDERLVVLSIEGNKIRISQTENKKLQKKGALAVMALTTELTDAIGSVSSGIERKMTVVFAHFPVSMEVKGQELYIKNLFGEKIPRVAVLAGETKVMIKGSDVTVTGCDKYDVGQTVANIMNACHARGQDTRVFQDGIYPAREE